MLDYARTRAWKSDDVLQAYTSRDTILYALGVGFGADPLDTAELRYVYEPALLAVPTMASVLASPGFWMRDHPELGIDYLKLVHGEQSVVLHGALPASGSVLGRTRVTRVVDKGEGRGAIVYVEKQLFDERGANLIATVEQVLFCRGDGGFSANGGKSDEAAPAAPALPQRPADRTVAVATRPDAALLYRLSGDLNPLHADPAVASRAGFPRPILHGLATYGMACRVVLMAECGGDPARLRSIRARLSAPVYPGETLRFDLWREQDAIGFNATAVERDTVVLANGWASLA